MTSRSTARLRRIPYGSASMPQEHLRRGEAGTAFVVSWNGDAIDRAAVPAPCRQRIAGYKCPKAVHIVPDLSKTSAAKVAKSELRNGFPASTG